ncbi:MAG: hypothetical protein OSB74_12980, partial [Verrucomicrobiota bacterium]|nr:hypothetical protein [Verrucomicrobiota bacterium]
FSESLPEIVICGVPIQAAYEYFISHNNLFSAITQTGKSPLAGEGEAGSSAWQAVKVSPM